MVPFFSFWLGYLIMSSFFATPSIITPALIGQPLCQACIILRNLQLNPCILSQKEDPDLTPDTIISQTPQAGTKTKQNQTVYLVVAKKPSVPLAPLLINRTPAECTKELEIIGIKPIFYTVANPGIAGHAIAQYPQAGAPIEYNGMIIYISSSPAKPIIWPSFKGKSALEVIEFLENHGCIVTCVPSLIAYHHSLDESSLVVDQRPLAGSLIVLNSQKPLHVQLKIT
jgi:serine/threonine-protein kinase